MLDLFGVRRGVPFRSTRGDGVPPTPSTRRVSPSQMKGGGALDFDGDALLALDDDDAEDALKTDDGDALDVSFDALDMNMDAPLKGPNGTPLSDMDGFSPAKNGISELFSSGR